MGKKSIIIRLEEDVIALAEQERARRGERSRNAFVASLVREACAKSTAGEKSRSEAKRLLAVAQKKQSDHLARETDSANDATRRQDISGEAPVQSRPARCSRHKRLDCEESSCR